MNIIKPVIIAFFVVFVSTSFITDDLWFRFETKEFGYTVEFPKPPELSSQIVPSAIGDLMLNMAVYDASADNRSDNFVYLANRTTYPDTLISSDFTEQVETFFRSAIDGAVSNVQGKLISEKNITIDAYPGRAIKVDYMNGLAIINMRFYLVKNHMYMLETISETSKDDNASINHFFDSFGLL